MQNNTGFQERRRSTDTEIMALKEEVAELRGDIKDLVEAWKTAKGITSFVKWLSGMILATGTVIALFKGITLK